jgi:hypothetical protein
MSIVQHGAMHLIPVIKGEAQGNRVCPRWGQSLRGFTSILLPSLASVPIKHLDSTFFSAAFARIPPNALALGKASKRLTLGWRYGIIGLASS